MYGDRSGDVRDTAESPQINLFIHLKTFINLAKGEGITFGSVCWPDPKDCPYYCLRLFVCLSVCLCVCVVHPPSAQVRQSILIKLGQMDHWGT